MVSGLIIWLPMKSGDSFHNSLQIVQGLCEYVQMQSGLNHSCLYNGQKPLHCMGTFSGEATVPLSFCFPFQMGSALENSFLLEKFLSISVDSVKKNLLPKKFFFLPVDSHFGRFSCSFLLVDSHCGRFSCSGKQTMFF